MTIQPYLFFEGRAEEAIEFYKSALNAEVQMLLRHKDSPVPPPPDRVVPGSENKVMHASLRIGDAVMNLSDGNCSGKQNFGGVTLALNVPNEAEAEKRFNALAQGGKVCMPLGKTFFSPKFGMVNDKFGVSWMVIVPQQR